MPELRRQGLWATFNLGISSHWHNLNFFVLTGCIQNSGFLLRIPGVHFYCLLAYEISLKGREDGLVDNTLAVDVWGPEFRSQTHVKWDRVVHSCHSISHLSYSKMRSRDREPPETHRASQPGVYTQCIRDRPSTVAEGEDQHPKLSSDLHMYNTPRPPRPGTDSIRLTCWHGSTQWRSRWAIPVTFLLCYNFLCCCLWTELLKIIKQINHVHVNKAMMLHNLQHFSLVPNFSTPK